MIQFWVHLMPFLLAFVLYLLFVQDSTMHYRHSSTYIIGMHFMTTLHVGCYLLYLKTNIARIVKERLYQNRLQRAFWFVFFMALIICLLYILAEMVNEIGNTHIHRVFSLLLYSVFLLGSSFVFFIHGRLKKVSEAVDIAEKFIDRSTSQKCKRKSALVTVPLTKEQKACYRNRIELFIQTLAYLDSDLNKDKFSTQLEIPVQHIAPFLRQEFGKGFNGFINQLRLNYAIRQLKNQELMYTIEDLSMVCGFSSRASFYRNFQAEFGCSPHQYRLDFGL
ncbi:helix-turn-helix transcriptional regulator [Sphingobacterium faecale]|uniref:Helix-turn-helix transcriptional regulator n=1 Tax=Sphingobacterium faecale TaxID=2803775 RepID=A0ABS1R2Z4_9SPHI|nr:AraC family transcriptional regulator [Sphingobacterium faecale]MBL1409058.1 helix-turn-helix transcriptional regulator [Sphingobacterium faecale]